jgi:hypothetical protein
VSVVDLCWVVWLVAPTTADAAAAASAAAADRALLENARCAHNKFSFEHTNKHTPCLFVWLLASLRDIEWVTSILLTRNSEMV